MHTVQNILVVLNPALPENWPLKRAQIIALSMKSRLHLLVCDTPKNDHSGYLIELTESLKSEGYDVTCQQSWQNSLHETIIAVQKGARYDLLIKQHAPGSSLKKILTPEDWKLLRYSTTPVLMVKTARMWRNGRVLAAVDAGNTEQEHRQLNTAIIETAATIARLAEGQLHVVSAYPTAMIPSPDPAHHLTGTFRNRYLEQCQSYAKPYDLGDERLHVKEGSAKEVIPTTADELKAIVTVIGTVARTGLSSMLIGNTAEALLDELENDVLVLKPDTI